MFCCFLDIMDACLVFKYRYRLEYNLFYSKILDCRFVHQNKCVLYIVNIYMPHLYVEREKVAMSKHRFLS